MARDAHSRAGQGVVCGRCPSIAPRAYTRSCASVKWGRGEGHGAQSPRGSSGRGGRAPRRALQPPDSPSPHDGQRTGRREAGRRPAPNLSRPTQTHQSRRRVRSRSRARGRGSGGNPLLLPLVTPPRTPPPLPDRTPYGRTLRRAQGGPRAASRAQRTPRGVGYPPSHPPGPGGGYVGTGRAVDGYSSLLPGRTKNMLLQCAIRYEKRSFRYNGFMDIPRDAEAPITPPDWSDPEVRRAWRCLCSPYPSFEGFDLPLEQWHRLFGYLVLESHHGRLRVQPIRIHFDGKDTIISEILDDPFGNIDDPKMSESSDVN